LSVICPVGLTPEGAAAAMRAGIDGFQELPYRSHDGEPIVGAVVPVVDRSLTGRARLIELLRLALEKAKGRLANRIGVPVFLCTRENARSGPSLAGIMSTAAEQADWALERGLSHHVPGGSVSGFAALSAAQQMLAAGQAKACVICAVDSLVDARALNWLDREGRLKMAENSDGVIPGEAAAVMLVTSDARQASSLMVRGIGLAEEQATVLNDDAMFADGMTAAARQALTEAQVTMHDVAFRMSDVAGESYAFEELVLTQCRLLRPSRETQDLWHPAAFVGDCGAAMGLIQLAWVEQAYYRRYAPGSIALLHASTPSGARAAVVVSAEE
jgi:3-oxoacyl-[acyl-carrier-protein] synthase I